MTTVELFVLKKLLAGMSAADKRSDISIPSTNRSRFNIVPPFVLNEQW